MRCLLSLVVLSVAAIACAAPVPTIVRQSRQFTVIDGRPRDLFSPGPAKSSSGEALLKLDADVLLLSAERIRSTLLRELELSADSGGKIRLVLYVATKPDDLIGVISSFSPAGWEYRIEIPDRIEPQKLIRGIIHSLLLELANRGQGPKSTELPLWLVEGLTLHVSAVAGPDLVFGSVPVGSMLRMVRETPHLPVGPRKKPGSALPPARRDSPLDYLKGARPVLASNRPLSFSELAHPSPQNLAGDSLKVYQSSAQLFVSELLHTKSGAAGLMAMVRELPRCWNWETALLRAFANEFPRVLDLEKMWAVAVLAFTARDPSQVWSRISCLDKLDEILLVPARVRTATNALPQRQALTLQQAIVAPDVARQTVVLQQKLPVLAALRWNAPQDVVPVIDAYYSTLATYLQKRQLASRTPENRMQASVSASLVAQNAIKELNRLDKQREALRPERTLSVNSPISP